MLSKDELINLLTTDTEKFNDEIKNISGGADLSESDLSGISVEDAVFDNADLTSSSFADSHLTNVKFLGCDLTSVDFTRANLVECSFIESVLNGTDFSYATVDYGNFADSDMAGSIFQSADFTKNNTAKIWAKLFIEGDNRRLFHDDEDCDKFLSNFSGELIVDKSSINAHDYALIKNPVHKPSEVKTMKSIKSEEELEAYKKAFERTDMAVMGIRDYIENNDNLSEYDISERLRSEFIKYGAKSLSFNSIVAINQNSAQAHYAKSSKETILKDGDLVLIDCGAYYESGLATDITRVFVKGEPNKLQKAVYTTVLKAFLNCFNSNYKTGFEIDTFAHTMLDNAIEGFRFNHGLGHGIGINVHEAPPNLSQNEIAKGEIGTIKDGMCFTIEPGLYNPEFFGVRLENSCCKKGGKIHSFTKMGYESKLINYDLLSEKEKEYLNNFVLL